MKKGIKILLKIASIVSIILIVIILGSYLFWLWFSSQGHPKTKGTVLLSGISSGVEIVRDTYGVPHIYAENEEDMFFAQGYVHAQDRFWQMEFYRRIGSGRLSEILGEFLLDTDIYIRTMGFHKIAEMEYNNMDEYTRHMYDSYASGVNSYIQNKDPAQLGLEFSFLKLQGVGVKIEPWTPVNSLTWGKIMSEDLTINKMGELYLVDLIRAVGYEMAKELFPAYPGNRVPYILSDFNVKKTKQTVEDTVSLFLPPDKLLNNIIDNQTLFNTSLIGGFQLDKALALGKGPGIGSNCWVLSGALTSTGKPLLACDPHLGIQIPSIWHEIDLKTRKNEESDYLFNARGVSFPGVPGIIIGHNEHIAWGISSLPVDTQDIYIEKIDPKDPNKYQYNSKWIDMDVLTDEIYVKGRKNPHKIQIRKTIHGPVISDLKNFSNKTGFNLNPAKEIPENLEMYELSLSWTALYETQTGKAILMLNRADNFEGFRNALRYFDCPPHNFVYADKEGNIGYQATGFIPVRSKGNGMIPAPGWTDDYTWEGFIPYEELPYVFNPKKGYIVATNNAILKEESYPYFLSNSFIGGYRAKRVTGMIEADKDGISIEDTIKMQNDIVNLAALDIISYLYNIAFEDEKVKEGAAAFLNWDGQMDVDSPYALLFGHFYYELCERIFNDQLTKELLPLDKLKLSWSRLRYSVLYLLENPENRWWDDTTTRNMIETRDHILKEAFKKTFTDCKSMYGPDIKKWKWGRKHTLWFKNQVLGKSGISVIESIFNRGPYPGKGGMQTVNTGDWMFRKLFNVSVISSMREIIDLNDIPSSLMINSTGQSGHPTHKHYDDLLKLWLKNEYHPVFFEIKKEEKNSFDILKLIPLSSAVEHSSPR